MEGLLYFLPDHTKIHLRRAGGSTTLNRDAGEKPGAKAAGLRERSTLKGALASFALSARCFSVGQQASRFNADLPGRGRQPKYLAFNRTLRYSIRHPQKIKGRAAVHAQDPLPHTASIGAGGCCRPKQNLDWLNCKTKQCR